jgi:sialic acid synthase SpsE
MRKFAHRCIFTTKKVKKGEKLTKQNTAILRPGKKKFGIKPKFYNLILSSKTLKNLPNGHAIKFEDFINR